MKKIYLVLWDNNEYGQDHRNGNGSAYATEELAKKAISMLEEAQTLRHNKEAEESWVWFYSWTIQELEVLTFVAPIEE